MRSPQKTVTKNPGVGQKSASSSWHKGAAAVTKREIHTGNIWEKSWCGEETVEKKKERKKRQRRMKGSTAGYHQARALQSLQKPQNGYIQCISAHMHVHTHTTQAAEAAAAAAMNTKYPNISGEFTLLSPLSGERVAGIIFVSFEIEHSKKKNEGDAP